MRKLLLLCACLWALAGSAQVLAGPPAVAVVRIFENGRSVSAVVTREGRSETVQFASGTNEKGLTQASEGYQKLLALLYQEGYTLESTFTTSSQYGVGFVTLILSKKQ